MANLMTATKYVKQEILNELRKGNLEVLKDLPPVMAMGYGIAMQNEAGDVKEKSSLNDEAINEAMLNRLKDSGVKERLVKEIEKERTEHNK